MRAIPPLVPLFIILVSLPAPCRAFVAPSPAPGAVDRRGEAGSERRESPQPDLAQDADWARFQHACPGWVAAWERGVPARLQGPGVTPEGALREDAEQIARAFLESTRAWIPVDELQLARSIEGPNGWWVHFTQVHDGLPVHGSRVTVRVAAGGTVVSVTNRSFAGIEVEAAPLISEAQSARIAREGLAGNVEASGPAQLEILPIWRGHAHEHRLVWALEQRGGGTWATFVDARSGELLWRYDRNRYAQVSGTVRAPIEPVTADGATVLLSMPYQRITAINPDSSTTDATTDATGAYALETPGASGRGLRAELRGTFAEVFDVADSAGSGNANEIQPLADGEPVEANFSWTLNPGGALHAAGHEDLDAYYHAMVAHDHILLTEPTFNALDYPMPVAVNVPEACNAFWDGVGVNFFHAEGPCVNTGRIADVIYHEYGHGITDLSYRPFTPSGAMHEGFSDYYAATITDQPLIGRGFFTTGGNIRRIDEDRVYPDDWVDEVHEDGLIIAGALWDLREIVGKSLADSLFHFARYGYADNYDDYFADMLLTDDDDGDVWNGTPHFDAIVSAFRRHGIGDYSIHVSHETIRDREDVASAIDFTAAFYGVFQIDPGTPALHMVIDTDSGSERHDVPLSATGAPREWTYRLQAQAAGTTVSYWFTAADTSGQAATYPEGGEADPLVFFVGTDVIPPRITHTKLPDLPADASAWVARATVRDNLDQPLQGVSLLWSQDGAAEQSAAMTGPAGGGDFAGNFAFTAPAVGALIEYHIEATDGSSAHNSAQDPSLGSHSFHLVRGWLRDLEANDGACVAAEGGEWEWGAPSDGVTPHSGAALWGTDLDANYDDASDSRLDLPPVDLTGWTRAALVFQHALISEPEYDGGTVRASTDGGDTWEVIVPDGGYDVAGLGSSGDPGFSGDQEAWREAQFDLSPFLGASDLRLQLRFTSDYGITAQGWSVDDIQVAERQIPVRPTGLHVESSGASAVHLSWAPVAPPTVLGYNVYRQDLSGGARGRLNVVPITQSEYDDATVEPGTLYRYWVSAVYDAGESALFGPVEGGAFVPAFSLDVEALTVSTDSAGTPIDTSLVISNAGNGTLTVNVYPADPGQTLEDVRYLVDLSAGAPRSSVVRRSGEPVPFDWARLAEVLRESGKRAAMPKPIDPRLLAGTWDTLGVDPVEPSVNPDLAACAVQTSAESFYLKLATHANWGDITTSFNFVALFDTNLDLVADALLLAGAAANQAFEAPAVLLDAEFNPLAGEPVFMQFASASSEAQFGFRKASLGSPRGVEFQIFSTGPNPTGRPLDQMPRQPDLPWLSMSDFHLEVEAGIPQSLPLSFNPFGMSRGEYHANLFLVTNDPTRATVTVPITFVVPAPVPVALEAFDAAVSPEGVTLRWTTVEPAHGFFVERRDADDPAEEFTRVSNGLIRGAGDRSYEFTDPTAVSDRNYEYLLIGLETDGSTTRLGPFAVSTLGLAPARLALRQPAPNPSKGGAIIRYGLPRAVPVELRVYAADGRLVRVLLRGPGSAGYQTAVWDGRDGAGRPVPAGLYFYSLRAGGEEQTAKGLLLR